MAGAVSTRSTGKEDAVRQQRLDDTLPHDDKHASQIAFWQGHRRGLTFLIFLALAGIGLLIRGAHRQRVPQKTQMQRLPREEAHAASPTNASLMQTKEMPSPLRDIVMNMAPSQHQSLESSITANRNSGNAILLALKRFLRIEDPIPVKAQGISLYAFWDSRHPLIRPSMEVTEDIGARMRTIGLWTVIHFVWLGTPVVTAAEAGNIIAALCHRLDELYPAAPPAYLIFHIEKLSAPKPRSPLSFMKKVKADIENAITDAKEVFVDDTQRLCDLGPGQLTNGWLPNRFRHYDPETQQRGWLMISPRRALLIDVSREQLLLLANLLQPYDTDANHGPGILSERYRELLMLVMQWNSNQDSFQAVNQLKSLVESGTKAIDGQVLLNFAVAGIAILIAFLLVPGQTYSAQLIASAGCLAVASLWFWLYARSGRVVFQLIGWISVLAIIPCFLVWSQIVSLFEGILKFFSHL